MAARGCPGVAAWGCPGLRLVLSLGRGPAGVGAAALGPGPPIPAVGPRACPAPEAGVVPARPEAWQPTRGPHGGRDACLPRGVPRGRGVSGPACGGPAFCLLGAPGHPMPAGGSRPAPGARCLLVGPWGPRPGRGVWGLSCARRSPASHEAWPGTGPTPRPWASHACLWAPAFCLLGAPGHPKPACGSEEPAMGHACGPSWGRLLAPRRGPGRGPWPGRGQDVRPPRAAQLASPGQGGR